MKKYGESMSKLSFAATGVMSYLSMLIAGSINFGNVIAGFFNSIFMSLGIVGIMLSQSYQLFYPYMWSAYLIYVVFWVMWVIFCGIIVLYVFFDSQKIKRETGKYVMGLKTWIWVVIVIPWNIIGLILYLLAKQGILKKSVKTFRG